MGDNGMDPCECIWSHEMAMRRLLSLLRQSQTVCTDTECFDEVPRLPGLPNAAEDNMLMMMVVWMAIALFMFMMRPGSMRNKADADYRNHDQDNNGSPPNPPAVN